MILLFSLPTPVGRFTISAPPETFEITFTTDVKSSFQLAIDGRPLGDYLSPYDAVKAVCGRKSRHAPWDGADFATTDYLGDWHSEVSDEFLFRLVASLVEKRPNQGYREIVDYFHFKHGYLMDRHDVGKALEEMAVTGQLDKLPSDFMVPAELRDLAERAKKWKANDASAP